MFLQKPLQWPAVGDLDAQAMQGYVQNRMKGALRDVSTKSPLLELKGVGGGGHETGTRL